MIPWPKTAVRPMDHENSSFFLRIRLFVRIVQIFSGKKMEIRDFAVSPLEKPSRLVYNESIPISPDRGNANARNGGI